VAGPVKKITIIAEYDNAGAEPVMLEWDENR
jgi:hypothetical protein